MHATVQKKVPKILLFCFLILAFTLSGCVPNLSREKEFNRCYKGLGESGSSFARSCAVFLKYGAAGGDYLIKKLKTENNLHIKTEAISLIGFTRCTNCADELKFYLNDPNQRVRVFTLDTLDKLNYPEIRELLREAIERDPQWSMVSMHALLLLIQKKNPDDEAFLQTLKKKNPNNEKMLKIIDTALASLPKSK
jgi:hypothetical protein